MNVDEASQLKQELRRWEVDFRKVHGRPPSKQDIDQEPSMAKQYKTYRDWKKVKENGGSDETTGGAGTQKASRRKSSGRVGTDDAPKVKSSSTRPLKVSSFQEKSPFLTEKPETLPQTPSRQRTRTASASCLSQVGKSPPVKSPLSKQLDTLHALRSPARPFAPTRMLFSPARDPHPSLQDEVVEATPNDRPSKRKRVHSLFSPSRCEAVVTMAEGEQRIMQPEDGDSLLAPSPKRKATTAAVRSNSKSNSKDLSLMARLRNAFSPVRKPSPLKSASKSSSRTATPSHWTSWTAPKADIPDVKKVQDPQLELSDFPVSSMNAEQALRSLRQAPIADKTKTSQTMENLRLKASNSLLRRSSFMKGKRADSNASSALDPASFMSPPARAGQALRVRAKTAPVSARKLSALLSPPPKKIGEAKDDLSDLESNGSADDGSPAGKTLGAKKFKAGDTKSTTEDTIKPEKKEGDDSIETEEPDPEGEDAESKEEVQEMLKHSDDEELVSTSEDEEYRKGPKKWKKKPINGRRYTSKRKLRPIDLKEGIPNITKSKRNNHSAPLKLNRKGKGGRFKAVNHALVDKSGPLNKNYSSGKMLAGGEEEENNPFDNFADERDEQSDASGDGERPTTTEADTSERKEESPINSADVDLDGILKTVFKLKEFRPGQRECMSRIVDGKSTILIQPTGAGKSLCYQIPAYILTRALHAICLVISPTISLMEDQVQTLPKCLTGACWNSAQSPKDTAELLDRLRDGKIQVLFVSPEKLASSSFLERFQSADLPRIAFACVDEVHCLSEWSHNFRPSYFQVKDILKGQLGVDCILGLTATATFQTMESICNLLKLNTEEDVIRSPLVRENFHWSISRETNRKKALAELLSREPYDKLGSIIVYCLRQSDADEVARYLRTVGDRQVESYHAGKMPKERKQIQKAFFSGKISVLCATIAFGLGINKSDVRAVVHYSLPKSLENYLQETGRAGRDGRDAYCHLFLHRDDYYRLRSLAYTDSIDSVTIKRFLDRILLSTSETKKKQKSQLRFFDIATMELDFDMRKSVMTTILSYLSMRDDGPLRLLPNIPTSYRLVFYKVQPKDLCEQEPKLKQLQGLAKVDGSNNSWSFTTQEACDKLQMTPMELNQYLYDLHGQRKMTVQNNGESFQLEMLTTPKEAQARLLELWQDLSTRVKEVEKMTVQKVDQTFALMDKCGCETLYEDTTNAELLKQGIDEYFRKGEPEDGVFATLLKENRMRYENETVKELLVERDLRAFVSQNEPQAARAIARIFHALPSPRYSYAEWARTDFWGRHIDFDFERVVELATREMVGGDEDEIVEAAC